MSTVLFAPEELLRVAAHHVVLSPHAASGDWLAMQDMATEAVSCIVKLYQRAWPANALINNELHDRWKW